MATKKIASKKMTGRKQTAGTNVKTATAKKRATPAATKKRVVRQQGK
jgi:hypothetical protein